MHASALLPAAFAVALLVAPCHIRAQDRSEDTPAAMRNDLTLEKLVVTASNCEDPLQDVPVVVSVLTSVDIEAAGIRNQNVADLTPGLIWTALSGGSNGAPVINLRTGFESHCLSVELLGRNVLDDHTAHSGVFVQNRGADVAVLGGSAIEFFNALVTAGDEPSYGVAARYRF